MALDPFANMVLGALSGTVSNMAVFPFELAKTKMQNARRADEKAHYKDLATSLRTITTQRGIAGLWTGSVPVLLGGAPESAIQLAAHSWVIAAMVTLAGAQNFGEADLPMGCQVLAGAFAGMSTIFATCPMEVLRLRAAGGDERGIADQVRDLGFFGLFHGYEATLLRDVPFSMLYFPIYCSLKSAVGQVLDSVHVPNPDTPTMLVAGFIAGAVASYLTTPCDAIKTRVQSTSEQKAGTKPARGSVQRLVTAFATRDSERTPTTGFARVKDVALDMVRQEGLRSLMCGADIRVMKLGPNMALTLALFESAQQILSVASP